MSTKHKTIRSVECIALFFIAPILLFLYRQQLAFRVFYLLVLLAVACILMLFKDPSFDRAVFRRKMTWQQARSIAAIFIPTACLMTLFTVMMLPSKFLVFLSDQPATWIIVVLIYPFLMVLPQELVFRIFFFHRYQCFFGGRPHALILFNALSFGLSHLFYGNWAAPMLSFLGGLLFAWRFQTTRSLLTVSVEHAVWATFSLPLALAGISTTGLFLDAIFTTAVSHRGRGTVAFQGTQNRSGRLRARFPVEPFESQHCIEDVFCDGGVSFALAIRTVRRSLRNGQHTGFKTVV